MWAWYFFMVDDATEFAMSEEAVCSRAFNQFDREVSALMVVRLLELGTLRA